MVTQIFKAQYYPSMSFLIAKIGNNSSNIWHSVFEAHNLIKSGSSYSVGYGQSILILNVPWLSNETDPYIHSRHEAL